MDSLLQSFLFISSYASSESITWHFVAWSFGSMRKRVELVYGFFNVIFSVLVMVHWLRILLHDTFIPQNLKTKKLSLAKGSFYWFILMLINDY